jgi:hypothetical protein
MVGPTVGISHFDVPDMPTVAQGAFPDMPQPADFGIFFCASRDMPTVAQTVARSAKNRQWIRCRVIAKSAGSEDPVLTSMGALLYGP